MTTLAPDTNDDEGAVGFICPFYTINIVVCVCALPLTIICRAICARRERHADRLGHLYHYTANQIGNQGTNGGVYSIEISEFIANKVNLLYMYLIKYFIIVTCAIYTSIINSINMNMN